MIRLGYSEADITPVHGEDLCGFALRQGPVTGIHDRLKSRWISLRADNGEAFLVGSADILSLSRNTYNRVKRDILSDLGGQRAVVSLSTTHTHSGPATVPLRYCGKQSRSYMAELAASLRQSAVDAATRKTMPVDVIVGSSKSDWGVNRRDPMGPVDPEVITVGFMDPKTSKPMAVVVNYACHPVILGHISNAVSADYPGYLARFIEEETGAPCLFLNGACGDINPKNAHQSDPAEARKAGEAIGKKALEALKRGKQIETGGIREFRRKVEIPVHQPKSAAELKRRLDMLYERFGLARELFSDRVARDIRLLQAGQYPQQVTIELSLLALGNELGILFVPGELFSSIGLKIKELMTPRKVLISGFSNGSVGYLPDRKAYEDGGYEPHFANFFYDFPEFEPRVEEHLLTAAEGLARDWQG